MSTHNLCFCGEIRKILFVYPFLSGAMSHISPLLAFVVQSDTHPSGDQEVTGLIPTRSGNILLQRLIMKYFFSPCH